MNSVNVNKLDGVCQSSGHDLLRARILSCADRCTSSIDEGTLCMIVYLADALAGGIGSLANALGDSSATIYEWHKFSETFWELDCGMVQPACVVKDGKNWKVTLIDNWTLEFPTAEEAMQRVDETLKWLRK